MDTDDIENKEHINELEARLYAKVYCENNLEISPSASTDNIPSSSNRLVTSKTLINNRDVSARPRGRYWSSVVSNQRSKNRVRQIKKANPSKEQQFAKSSTENLPPAPMAKQFQPYTSIFGSKTGVIPAASGNDPEKQGSNRFIGKQSLQIPLSAPEKCDETNNKKQKLQSAANPQKQPATKKRDSRKSGPFFKNVIKLEKLGKLQKKKTKGQLAKQNKNKQQKMLGTIVLSDSEDDEADVVEIPAPPPPLLVIESSDDEISFAIPKNAIKGKNSKIDNNLSRCASPASVMSDDFIGQSDRSRLLQGDRFANDDELVNCVEQENGVESSLNEPLETPEKNPEVSENESSDMPDDSIYSKGHSSKAAKESVQISSNEDEEQETSGESSEIEFLGKPNRLLKRRASNSIRNSSDRNDAHSDDNSSASGNFEDTNFNESLKTSTPFIIPGEAVEKNRGEQIKRRHNKIKKRFDVNSTTETEFLDMLSTIVRGSGGNSSDDSNDLDDIDDAITARAIAEDVLQKEKPSLIEDEPIPQTEKIMSTLKAIDEMLENSRSKQKSPTPEPDPDVSDLIAKSMDSAYQQASSSENQSSDSRRDHGKLLRTVFSNKSHIGWNEEMKRFYENTWGDRRFNVFKIRRLMNRADRWAIHTNDRFPRYNQREIKCHNCLEYGHARSKCTMPKKPITCYMCGDIGHNAVRCTNALCLRCGKKTQHFTKSCAFCSSSNKFICPICKIRGHSVENCPDKWRRYHSTILPNSELKTAIPSEKVKYCCVCAQSGHYAEHCKWATTFSEFPLIASDVKCYAKSYANDPFDRTPADTGYHIFYEPDVHAKFKLADRVTEDQYYGRFLMAVGLDKVYAHDRALEEQVLNQKRFEAKKRKLVRNPFAVNEELHDESHFAPSQPEELDDGLEVGMRTTEIEAEDTKMVEIKQQNKQPDIDANSFSFIKEIEVLKTGSTELKITFDKTKNIRSDVSKFMSPKPVQVRSEFLFHPPLNGLAFKSEVSAIAQETTENQNPDKLDASLETNNSPPLALEEENSNYSFSRDFEENNTEFRALETLPDFIPLGADSAENNDDEIDSLIDLPEAGISHQYVANLTENIIDSCEPENQICKGRIYLSNYISKYLFSPKGNKFLLESAAQFNVKTSIDWTRVGNVLVVEGTPANQDKFHDELKLCFRKVSEETNKNLIKSSQRVPRKREALIKFLQSQILQLDTSFENAGQIYQRLRLAEEQSSSFFHVRTAERTRRLLNMILIGQGGLDNGHQVLAALLVNLQDLLKSSKEIVTNDLREIIDKNWSYIFSSQPHENYQQLLKQYLEMKRTSQLPKLELNYSILGKQFLDVKLSKEQIKNLSSNFRPQSSSVGSKPQKQEADESNETETKTSEHDVIKDNIPYKAQSAPPVSPTKPQEPTTDSLPPAEPLGENLNAEDADKSQQCSQTNTPHETNSFEADKNVSNINNKCELLLNTLYSKNNLNQRSSLFWSRETMKFIEQTLTFKITEPIRKELEDLYEKGKNGQLSYGDFSIVQKFHKDNIEDKID